LKTNTVEILLVEDNPGDVRLMVEALKETRVPSRLHLAEDGVQAMSFLRRKGTHGKAPRPDLVLLDLNLPKKDGREVLAEIKTDPQLRSIPVVVLTTSQAETDVLRSYDLHANCYISKPVGLENFIRVIQSIEGFWLETVRLPRQ
jgi:CheY-like chemotaxis protein